MIKRPGMLVTTLSVTLLSFVLITPRKTKVYLIGDSTMCIKPPSAYPEAGWGMPFAFFFDQTVQVENRAQNGRSTRTFMEARLWKPVIDSLKEGDYVFIQFGHNDEVSTKDSYTDEKKFKENLLQYVNETRSRNANPVLITPVARRRFDSSGNVEGSHEIYSSIVRETAKVAGVPLIDLDKSSQELLQKLGPVNSKALFLNLEKDEHPNFPDGKEDNTHFSEYGARKIAELVLAGIRSLKLDLASKIVNAGKTSPK